MIQELKCILRQQLTGLCEKSTLPPATLFQLPHHEGGELHNVALAVESHSADPTYTSCALDTESQRPSETDAHGYVWWAKCITAW